MQDGNQARYTMRSLTSGSKGRRAISGSLFVGLSVAGLVLLGGLMSSKQPLSFFNLEGLFIVFGGTVASTLIQFSLADLRSALSALKAAMVAAPCTAQERMEILMDLSRRVKDRGVLTLEDEAHGEPDEFFRLGLMLVADGRTIEDTQRILRKEMESSRECEWRSVQVWETMGNFAPAMGLIGTLIGLIQMLGALQDTSTMASSMAMALVATLYGSVGANLFFFPIAGKLRVVSQERELCKSVTFEGLLSISQLENPMMLEQRLQSFARVAVQG
jgi:chemotaxis protein MotA